MELEKWSIPFPHGALETTEALLERRGMGPTSVVLSGRTALSYRAASRGAGMSNDKEHNYLQHRENIRGSRLLYSGRTSGQEGEMERTRGSEMLQPGR